MGLVVRVVVLRKVDVVGLGPVGLGALQVIEDPGAEDPLRLRSSAARPECLSRMKLRMSSKPAPVAST